MFVNKSVLADWGNRRQYRVSEVVFNSDPVKKLFELRDGSISSVAKYFEKAYNKTFTQPGQPLFQCEVAGTQVFLPPEFCLIDGQATMKKDDIKDVLKKLQQTPAEKMQKVK